MQRVCHSCGAVYRVSQLSNVTVALPRFCPYCGGAVTALVHDGASTDPFRIARCFQPFPHDVLTALWQDWKESPAPAPVFLVHAYTMLRKYLAQAMPTQEGAAK